MGWCDAQGFAANERQGTFVVDGDRLYCVTGWSEYGSASNLSTHHNPMQLDRPPPAHAEQASPPASSSPSSRSAPSYFSSSPVRFFRMNSVFILFARDNHRQTHTYIHKTWGGWNGPTYQPLTPNRVYISAHLPTSHPPNRVLYHHIPAPYQYHDLQRRRQGTEGGPTGPVLLDHWAWPKRALSVVLVRFFVF